MDPTLAKRRADQHILSEWIENSCRVLDLGCGRGILLELLKQQKRVYGIGIDLNPAKIQGCVKRGVNAYQGEIVSTLGEFPDRFFDWVICSRTVQELEEPGRVIAESLRAGRQVAVGFVNHAYWKNRISLALSGSRVTNDVFPLSWHEGRPYNPVTIEGFEAFCRSKGYRIERRAYLRGNWRTPCRYWPNLRAGYALYAISQGTEAAKPA